jgi:hypothetical protein
MRRAQRYVGVQLDSVADDIAKEFLEDLDAYMEKYNAQVRWEEDHEIERPRD